MAKNVAETTNTNNLESNKKKEYKVTFGKFDENEKGEMNFPPKNAKIYKDLEKTLETSEIVIEAKSYTKVLGENGKIVARVSEDGKVLTGKLPKEKSSKKSNKKAEEQSKE